MISPCELCGGVGYHLKEGGAWKASLCRCMVHCANPECDEGFTDHTDDRGYDFVAPCPVCGPVRLSVRLLNRAALPGKHSPKPLKARTPEQRELFSYLRGWLKAWEPGGPGWVLSGPPGVGKTHALVAVIRGLIQTHGVMARFVHVAGLMLDLRLAMNDPHASPASVLGSLATVPVLGLDELVRPRTEWGQEVISELFQLRYQANLTTLATTNLDEDGLAVGLGPGLGELVTSRLKEWAPIITIGGRDLRTQ